MTSKKNIYSNIHILTLKEHTDCSFTDIDFPWEELFFSGKSEYSRYVIRHKEPVLCFKLDTESKLCSTNYMIGIDWIEENKTAIQVLPKLSNSGHKINYSKMLMDALSEPDNFSHLDDLLNIDFNKPYIPLT